MGIHKLVGPWYPHWYININHDFIHPHREQFLLIIMWDRWCVVNYKLAWAFSLQNSPLWLSYEVVINIIVMYLEHEQCWNCPRLLRTARFWFGPYHQYQHYWQLYLSQQCSHYCYDDSFTLLFRHLMYCPMICMISWLWTVSTRNTFCILLLPTLISKLSLASTRIFLVEIISVNGYDNTHLCKKKW